MKIQYPGVATSIHSDLNNLKSLVTYMNVLPPGLFIDEIIKVASVELSAECDYVLEAQHQQRYRDLVAADPVLSRNMQAPKLYPEYCTKQILTSEYVKGVTIEKALDLPEPVRNAIARSILVLTIRELFQWRFVQSDPNFGNYLYDDSGPQRIINLIDFGATREYSEDFMNRYLKVVWAAANGDRAVVLEESMALGFLTGDEAKEMVEAHVDAAMIVGEPFKSHEPFDFGSADLTKRIGVYGSVFLKYRLKAPPTEAYSLHRKLAGAILLCIRLRAKIVCRDVLEEAYESYQFDNNVQK
jgi:aarF domain-containing kinase